MRVFKFGGASIKDAAGVKNLARIVKLYLDQPLVIVVSAMGKSTNLLEKISDFSHRNQSINAEYIQNFVTFHREIINDLFEKGHVINDELTQLTKELEKSLIDYLDKPYDFYYDQIVSYGELISTRIIHHLLEQEGVVNTWVNAGDIIKTNSNYREGRIAWEESSKAAKLIEVKKGEALLTQGFIGRSDEGYVTTLGREGSDYTAAILAYVFEADNVVIWKDVPGMLNADPRIFKDAVKLDEISFKEAIELSYYGATVIHPKTLQPLKEKNLPLFVKSFEQIEAEGSKISNNESFDRNVASYILKENQVLISITPPDLTFVVEENLSHIFSVFSEFKVQTHLMQNSALNFSVCVNDDQRKIPALIEALSKDYKVLFNKGLSLLTVRHYSEELLDELLKGKEVLLEQKTRNTARYVYR
jgi:aspartate kinase